MAWSSGCMASTVEHRCDNVPGQKWYPAVPSGYQRETAGTSRRQRDTKISRKKFSVEGAFGASGLQRPSAPGPTDRSSFELWLRALEVPRESVGELRAVPLPDQDKGSIHRSEVVGDRRGRRRQDTVPRLFVSWLCPARCRRTSKGVPTCTCAAEPLLEVAGFEPASSGAATGLLRAQPTSGCRGWHLCRRAVPPRNQRKFPQ